MDRLRQPFDLLDSARSRWFWVLFGGIFGSLFLFLFNPLNSSSWQFDFDLANRFTIWAGGLLAVPVLMLSQFVLRPWWVRGPFSMGHFLLWILLEIFLLSLLFMFIYGDETADAMAFMREYAFVLKHTFLITSIPFLVAFLVLRSLNKESGNEIQQSPSAATRWVRILDENDKEILRIQEQQILYFKSEDNYVAVHYVIDRKPLKKLVRTNLKKLEKELNPQPFARTHRSYMVNINNVLSVQPARKGLSLTITEIPDSPIPVSNSFKDQFREIMDGREGPTH